MSGAFRPVLKLGRWAGLTALIGTVGTGLQPLPTSVRVHLLGYDVPDAPAEQGSDPVPEVAAGPALQVVALWLEGQDRCQSGIVPDRVIAAAGRLVDLSAGVDSVWPGYWSEPRPYVVTDWNRWSMLYSDQEPPSGYRPLQPPGLPMSREGRLFLRCGPFDDAVIQRTRQCRTPSLAFVPLASPGGSSQEEYILHETFHFWQMACWDESLFQPIDCTPQRYDQTEIFVPSTFHQEAVREMRVLAAAVAADDQGARSANVLEYLRMRRARLGTVDPLINAIDQRQERREGTAMYTGLAGSIAVHHTSGAGAGRVLQDTIAALLQGFPDLAEREGYSPSDQAGQRVYYTGAAMAFLVDGYAVENWRDEVAEGEFLDVLLGRAVGSRQYLRWVEDFGTSRPCHPGRGDQAPGPVSK